MRTFIKTVFGSCLGTILALLIIIFLLIIIGTLGSLNKDKIEDNAVLLLDFKGLLPELTDNVASGSPYSFENPDATSVYEVIDYIKHAASDSRISQIVLKPESASMGAVTMNLLADAIRELNNNTEKTIYSFGDFYTQSGYMIASESDSIFLNPEGGIDLKGFGVESMFVKEFLDKLGIKMHVFYDGEFKSGAEMFYRNDMSDNARLQLREFLDEIHDNFVSRLSENRSIPIEALNNHINNYDFSISENALKNNAIDGRLQWYEFEDKLRANLGLKKGKKINYVSFKEYKSKTTLDKKKSTSKNKIAVIFAEGEIRYDSEENGIISEKSFHTTFDRIRKDDKIKAIVLRVNSPGGSAYASEAILQEIKAFQKDSIPVIASFSNYAASGGYYISCSADAIIAEENTLTGSIGAFSVLPDASAFFNDKLGIHFDTVQTGAFANGFSVAMALSDKKKAYLQRSNNKVYNTFINRVAEGRNMPESEVRKVAEGRIWAGQKAKELNLVDEIGGIEMAIQLAAEKAGIEDYKIKNFPKIEKPQWQVFLEQLNANQAIAKLMTSDNLSEQISKELENFNHLSSQKSPMVLMPFKLKF